MKKSMNKFITEFNQFAFKGNIINLAVGIIIGAAFQGLVNSLTNNILSPIIGLFTGKNFDAHHIAVFGVTIGYGAFITAVINFFIMAFVVFLIVKFINKVTSVTIKKPETPEPRKCPFCITVVDAKATRCPACSSWIKPDENKERQDRPERQHRRPPRKPKPNADANVDPNTKNSEVRDA